MAERHRTGRPSALRACRLSFTPDEDGTYYVAAGVPHWEDGQFHNLSGTYTLFVTDVSTDDFAAFTATTGVVAVGAPPRAGSKPRTTATGSR